MRFHTVFLLVIALGIGSSNGFFLKKAKALPATLAAVKFNFVSDAKAAVENLKEAGHLKAKAVKGGIKAVGNAKLGVLKGIKDAKVGVLKGIAGAKVTKIAALKAGKAAFAKTVVAAKLAPVIVTGVKVGALKNIIASNSLGQNLLQGIKSQSSSSSSSGSTSLLSSGLFNIIGGSLAGSSSISSKPSGSLLPNFASILTKVGSGNGNVALYPAPSVIPTRINIVTYKSSNGESSISGNNHGYESRPNIDQRSKQTLSSATNFGSSLTQHDDNIVSAPAVIYGNPLSQQKNIPLSAINYSTPDAQKKIVSNPVTSYGTPVTESNNIPVPAINYGIPEGQTIFVPPPVNNYGTPFKAIPPSTSYGSPILR